VREPAGARVKVVRAPIGPTCTIIGADGAIVHGHRVPDDFVGCASDHVFTGTCVTATTTEGRLDERGEVVKLATTTVARAVPPPVLPPLPRIPWGT
jgi:hypothetical protein